MDTKIETLNLSLTDQESMVISDMKKKLLEDDLSSLPPIKENDINISTSYIFDAGDKIEVGVFFRNGLKNTINFDLVPLMLLDENNNTICTQIFQLKDLGNIPSFSARPYELFFSKENLTENMPINNNWKVVFKNNIKAINTVKVEYEDFPDMPLEAKNFFESYLNSLPPLEKGTISFNIYSVKLYEDNQIKVTFLIRNGNNTNSKLEILPISLFDNNRNLIYSSTLKFNDVEVNAQKAKLINFVLDFSKDNLSHFDLSNITAKFIDEQKKEA